MLLPSRCCFKNRSKLSSKIQCPWHPFEAKFPLPVLRLDFLSIHACLKREGECDFSTCFWAEPSWTASWDLSGHGQPPSSHGKAQWWGGEQNSAETKKRKGVNSMEQLSGEILGAARANACLLPACSWALQCNSAGPVPSATALVSLLGVFCSKVMQEVSSILHHLVEKKHRISPPLDKKHQLFLLLNAHASVEGLKAKALKRKEKGDISAPWGMGQWKTTEAAGLLSWSIHYCCGWWHYSSCSPLGRLLHWRSQCSLALSSTADEVETILTVAGTLLTTSKTIVVIPTLLSLVLCFTLVYISRNQNQPVIAAAPPSP